LSRKDKKKTRRGWANDKVHTKKSKKKKKKEKRRRSTSIGLLLNKGPRLRQGAKKQTIHNRSLMKKKD